MGYFFNVVLEDYDNLKSDYYLELNVAPSKEKKLKIVQDVIGDSDKIKLRTFTHHDLFTYRSEPSYYIFTKLKHLNINEEDRDYHRLPLFSGLRDFLQTQKNLFIVFLKNEDSELTEESIKYYAEITNTNIEKLLLINENDFNLDKIIDLSLKKVKNTFNVVYDTWDSEMRNFKPNLSNYSKRGERYRIVEGLFRFYNYFNDIRNCPINEVYINKNENFYYFINCDIISEEFKTKFEVPEYLKEIHRTYSNFNIVLLNEHEFENKDFLSLLDKHLKNENIDTKRIYVWNNNSKLEKYKNEVGTDINVYSLDFLVKFISNHMINFKVQPKFITEKEGSFFLCHNRGPKPHRYGLLCLLKKHNILDNVDWSLILGWYKKEMGVFGQERNFYDPVFDSIDFNYYSNEVNYFSQIDIKKSKYEENETWFDQMNGDAQIEWKDVYQIKTYENSYVNIVTESCYEPQEIHITEKSIKPFYFFQIPIFVASHNHVKFLKNRFGFDLFEDIINHDYDNEQDNRKRLKLVFEEIKRLNENKELIIDFYKKNENRFIENQKKVIAIHESKRDVEYFNYLINKNYEQ